MERRAPSTIRWGRVLCHPGRQVDRLDADDLFSGTGFAVGSMTTHTETTAAGSRVQYDLLGEIAEKTQLTRRTCGAVLSRVKASTSAKYRQNPEQLITEAARLINEQKATVVIEHLAYNMMEERFDRSIFTENQTKQDFTKAGEKLTKHIYFVAETKASLSFMQLVGSPSWSSSVWCIATRNGS